MRRLASSGRSQKILLGKLDTGMAQDVVCSCDVKKELRDAERQQQRFSGEFSFCAVLESENDLLVAGGLDLRARQALYEIDCRRDPRLELWDVRIGIGKRLGRA